MPSQPLTTSPVALSGLTDDTIYRVQNRGVGTLYVEQAPDASQPDATSAGAHLIERREFHRVKPTAGNSVWIWSEQGGGHVAFSEEPTSS